MQVYPVELHALTHVCPSVSVSVSVSVGVCVQVNGAEHSVAYAIRVLNDVALFSRRITVRRRFSP